MTLNGVMALILRYFTEFGSFRRKHCVKVHVYDVIVKNFTFAISSPDEFLVFYYGEQYLLSVDDKLIQAGL